MVHRILWVAAFISTVTTPQIAQASAFDAQRAALLNDQAKIKQLVQGARSNGLELVGRPYEVFGKWYVPHRDDSYHRKGIASWYGGKFHGRKTANGEIFDKEKYTAAHPTLPIPSYVKVTNLENGHSLIVRVNDRGPFSKNRIIDLSEAAARKLDFVQDGTSEVEVTFIEDAPGKNRENHSLYGKFSTDDAETKQQFSQNMPRLPVPDLESDWHETPIVEDLLPPPVMAKTVPAEKSVKIASKKSFDRMAVAQRLKNAKAQRQGKKLASTPESELKNEAQSFITTEIETKNAVPQSTQSIIEQDGFVVQLAAFSSERNARRAQRQLSDQAFIKVANVRGKELYRLYSGPWPNKDSARSARVQAEALGFEQPFIKRLMP